jgi:hypothetical protein
MQISASFPFLNLHQPPVCQYWMEFYKSFFVVPTNWELLLKAATGRQSFAGLGMWYNHSSNHTSRKGYQTYTNIHKCLIDWYLDLLVEEARKIVKKRKRCNNRLWSPFFTSSHGNMTWYWETMGTCYLGPVCVAIESGIPHTLVLRARVFLQLLKLTYYVKRSMCLNQVGLPDDKRAKWDEMIEYHQGMEIGSFGPGKHFKGWRVGVI